MKSFRDIFSNQKIILLLSLLFNGFAFALAIKWYLLLQIAETPNDLAKLPYLLIGVVACILYAVVLLLLYGNRHRDHESKKFINLALSQIEALEEKLIEKNPEASTFQALDTPKNWPWGDHHTELLGHLSAAAWRHWKLYDPSDIGSAPTNKSVVDWLVKERKVSKSMAEAIASILRVDGLRTGPRE